jgi:hypothetical protein
MNLWKYRPQARRMPGMLPAMRMAAGPDCIHEKAASATPRNACI